MTLDKDKWLLSTANLAVVLKESGVDGGELAKTLPARKRMKTTAVILGIMEPEYLKKAPRKSSFDSCFSMSDGAGGGS